MSTIALHLTLNISETVRDRGLVPRDHNMAYGIHDRWRHMTPKGAVRQYGRLSGVLRRRHHRRLGLATLPSVGAVP